MKVILVVDDDEQVRSDLKRYLSPDYEILEANNREKALRLYSDHRADLVITDIYLPEKDGLDVIRQLAGADPAPAIIAMSGRWEMYGCDCELIALAFGARLLLSKPFTRREVLRSVNAALQVGIEETVIQGSYYSR